MARKVVQADIDQFGAAITANGIFPPMMLDDYLIDHGDKNQANGNVFHDWAMDMRPGGTVWIRGGRDSSNKGYNSFQIGEGFPHTTSTTGINTSTLTTGGTASFTVGSGLVIPVGYLVKARSTVTNAVNLIGTVTSYTGTTLNLNNLTRVNIGSGYATTSTTSINLSTAAAPLTITVGTGKSFVANQKVQLVSASSPANTLTGTITSYNSTNGEMILNPITKVGTATLADWNVNLYVDSWQFVVEAARSSAASPVHIRFFDGPAVIERLDALSLDARAFEINNINHVVLDFETNLHPGFRDEWGSGKKDKFGFHSFQTYKERDAMALKVDNHLGTMETLIIRGAHMSTGSFAGLRASLGTNYLTKFIIERCLVDRTIRGEGFYIGLTSAAPWPIHQNMIVRDNLMLFTAAEAIQLQQLGNGSRIYNNTIFVADIDYRTAFQADQDTGIQLDISQGDVWFYNNLIYGMGKNGMQIFNKDMSSQGYPFGTGITKLFNNLWAGTKAGLTARLHSSADLITRVVWRDNDITDVQEIYGDVGTIRNYNYDMDGDSPAVFIGGKVPVDTRNFQNSTVDVTQFNLIRETVPLPEFINSGFDGINIHKITNWGEYYTVGIYAASNNTTSPTTINLDTLTIGGSININLNTSTAAYVIGDKVKVYSRAAESTKFFYGTVGSYSGTTLRVENITSIGGTGTFTDYNVGKRISYTAGEDIVILAENQSTIVQNFYKCITDHVSHEDLRPDIPGSFWELVQWDSGGKNKYDPLYNGTPASTDYMTVAGDFRLKEDNYHNLRNRGITCSPQPTVYTKLGWEWKESANGTVRSIPGAYDIKLDFTRYSYLISGRYFRSWVERKRNDNTFMTRIYSPWNLVP